MSCSPPDPPPTRPLGFVFTVDHNPENEVKVTTEWGFASAMADPDDGSDSAPPTRALQAVGHPSYRSYRLFDLGNESHISAYNLLTVPPEDTQDQRWADYLRYYSYTFTVAPTCLPPASCHLPDSIVGQLIEMAKAGHILLKTLGYRWPNVFDNGGRVYTARRPMGDAYLINGKIALVNNGTHLLCGALHKPNLPKEEDPQAKWWWSLHKAKPRKALLIASDISPVKAEPKDLQHSYPALNSAQRKQNAFPEGRIFPDDSGKPSPDVRMTWKLENMAPQREAPSPVQSIRPILDPGDDAEAVAAAWDNKQPDIWSVGGRVGLMAFAAKIPAITKHKEIRSMSAEQIEELTVLAAKKRVKTEDEATVAASAGSNKKPTPTAPTHEPAPTKPPPPKTAETTHSSTLGKKTGAPTTTPTRGTTVKLPSKAAGTPTSTPSGRKTTTLEEAERRSTPRTTSKPSPASTKTHPTAPNKPSVKATTIFNLAGESQKASSNPPKVPPSRSKTPKIATAKPAAVSTPLANARPEQSAATSPRARKVEEREAAHSNASGFRQSSDLVKSLEHKETQEPEEQTCSTDSIDATIGRDQEAFELIKKIQAYEDVFARNTALTARFVMEQNDLFRKTLTLIMRNTDLTKDEKGFLKNVAKRSEGYVSDFIGEFVDLSEMLKGSAYDRFDTLASNYSKPSPWFPSGTLTGNIPNKSPALLLARAVWSERPAYYPVSRATAATKRYQQLARGHLKKHAKKSFSRRRDYANNPNACVDEEERTEGESDEAADEEDWESTLEDEEGWEAALSDGEDDGNGEGSVQDGMLLTKAPLSAGVRKEKVKVEAFGGDASDEDEIDQVDSAIDQDVLIDGNDLNSDQDAGDDEAPMEIEPSMKPHGQRKQPPVGEKTGHKRKAISVNVSGSELEEVASDDSNYCPPRRPDRKRRSGNSNRTSRTVEKK